MLEPEQSHPRSMGRPYPGTRSLEEGDKGGHRAMHLHELDHYRICAWIQEECCHSLSVSMQSRMVRTDTGVGSEVLRERNSNRH